MILRMRFLTAFLALNITTNLQIRIRDLSVALRVLVAFTSLFIYGASVLALHQDRFHPISVEGGPAGAALSHRLLGSPLGLQDSGFAQYLRFQTEGLSAAQFVRRAVEVAPNTQSHEYVLAPDGQGVGTIVAWTLAFWFFGLHAHSITYLYLLIIAVSAIAFLVRYPDERMAAVPIFLLSLTLLLVTPVSALPVGVGALIGGSRYYAVVGILPALHWCFEFLRIEAPPQIRTATRYRLLAIQIAILGLAVLVRGAPGYLLGPIAASAIFGWWRSRDASSRRRVLLLFFVPMAVLIVGLTIPPRLAFPEFAAQGRLYGLVWHRAFIGFVENPAWPFPGMREKYDCSAQIPDGLAPGVLDRNGLCVWDAYGPNRTRSMEEVGNELFDGNYEAALRSIRCPSPIARMTFGTLAGLPTRPTLRSPIRSTRGAWHWRPTRRLHRPTCLSRSR